MKLITLAIHTYPFALQLKNKLEKAGIETTLQNVDLQNPGVAPGVRVRIHERDLARALRLTEDPSALVSDDAAEASANPLIRVLVPTDLSDHSENVVRLGLDIAAAHQCGALFLHAFLVPSMMMPPALSDSLDFDRTEEMVEDAGADREAEKRMGAFSRRIAASVKSGELPDARFETRVAEGVPEEAILRAAKEIKPALIVMGTRAAETKEREVVGSVTAEVLDSVRFPVLSVPGNCTVSHTADFREILFIAAPDQQDILALDLMTRLMNLSEGTNVRIMNLPSRRNPGPDEKVLENLRGYCSKNFPGLNFTTEAVSASTMASRINELHAAGKVNLIVVPTRRRNLLTRIFNPTLAHRLLFRADIPMLSIPV